MKKIYCFFLTIKLSSLWIIYWSLSEFKLKHYLPIHVEQEKKEVRLLFFHKFMLSHNASQIAADINRAWGEWFNWDRKVDGRFGSSAVGIWGLKIKVEEKVICNWQSTPENTLRANSCQSIRQNSQIMRVSIISIYLMNIVIMKKFDKRLPRELI